MKNIWLLFKSFFCIGLFTFGGGYAMLPMLQREVLEKNNWATEEELLDCYAIAQCTPGVIAVNTATYIGAKVAKTLGAAVATIAVVLPSFLIISVIALVLKNFMEYSLVGYAFAGIRVAVAVLVAKALINLYKKGVKGAFANGVFLAVFALSVVMDLSPIVAVAAAIVLGTILHAVEKRKFGRDEK